MRKPPSVITAVHAIWITIALDLLVTALGLTGADSLPETLRGCVFSFAVYGLLSLKISQGRNWARNFYAVLLAAEVAALFAFDNKDVSDLEIMVSYLMLPVEGWVLFQLFRAESDEWFKENFKLQRR